jgi:hypothetical protein
MRLVLTAGAALAALTVAAYAHPETRAFFVRGGDHANPDANADGWLSRDEASAAFTRAFQDMDSNDDGRIDDGDQKEFGVSVHSDFDPGDCTQTVEPLEGGNRNERRITVICGDDDGGERRVERRLTVLHAEDLDERERARIEREIARAEAEAERAGRDAERAAREAERLAEDAERMAEEIERRIERQVIVMAGDDAAWAPLAPLAPLPPVPPVPGVAPVPPVAPPPLMLMYSQEADRNGDGAVSREEFVAQQLRYFDASDADGDGRIRIPTPPEPPTPPAPPRP